MKSKATILYDIYTNTAEEFKSINALANYLGGKDIRNLITIARGNGKNNYLTFSSRYTLFYKDEYSLEEVQNKLDRISKASTRITPIMVIDTNLNKTYTFNSLRQACEELGVSRRSAGRVLNGEKDSFKGYIFKRNYQIHIPVSLDEITYTVHK